MKLSQEKHSKASKVDLPPEDKQYLNTTFPSKWKIESIESECGLIVNDYSLPEGYNFSKADLLILIPNNYPMAHLDMFYLDPGIARKDGKPIEALQDETHLGKKWQRWSRHYQWRAGLDDIKTHMYIIENSLKKELKK